jgi:AcrR family transcriptional regulator
MPETSRLDPRQATAARNVEAILDAVQVLLQRRQELTISAVATEAGVSRPTVYSHFPERRQMVEALVERTVARAMAAVAPAEPESGPAADALRRLLLTSWQQIALHQEIAQAASDHLSAESMRRTHAAARAIIASVIERGRAEGAFRSDLPIDWCVSALLALVHAGAEEVRAGRLAADEAIDLLQRTVLAALATDRAE